ncbi:hypothetical protein TIFTF001_029249 [Ficus carica]|uniref:Uncharacterized protein n=1 Tax=Ficus carica TaxID=3494 RepID=A0AA88DRG5_FICCA|nr:hypothetical protein TIFTF001_029249 [Ficus carica]
MLFRGACSYERQPELQYAYESIPTIAGKFTTKHVEANPHMLSWTSADNVKFDAVMSTLIVVSEKHCFVMMPTDEELKEPCVVPQAPHNGFLDSDIGVVVDKGVKAAMDFLNADKDEDEEEDEDDERENEKVILKYSMSSIPYMQMIISVMTHEKGDEEVEIAKDEDDKGENDEEKYKEYEEGEEEEAKENEEEKYENGKGNEEEKKPKAAKEKEDEEAKEEEEEIKNKEAAKE